MSADAPPGPDQSALREHLLAEKQALATEQRRTSAFARIPAALAPMEAGEYGRHVSCVDRASRQSGAL